MPPADVMAPRRPVAEPPDMEGEDAHDLMAGGGCGSDGDRNVRDDFNPYGGVGIAGPVGEFDPYGNGFFTGGGGQIRLRGGRPHYDYDRGYSYQWASTTARRELDKEARVLAPPARCTVENRVRVCRGW